MGLLDDHPSVKEGYSPGGTPDTQAHDWSDISCGPTGLSPLNDSIIDSYGRVCLLRGANVSGGSKIPINHNPATFPHDHRSVTFVNRPFPLEEAPQHFARLRRWGLSFIRFNVTWEAIEHEGPGKYDTEYLEYLRKLLSLLPEFGIVAFVSIHQDVWSRYSGGSGAPAWTLELAGFDLATIGGECGAAYLGGVQGNGVEVDRGRWPTGYQKLAASTMATLFWSGNTYAPKLRVKNRTSEDMVNIQDFLQDHFLDAFDQLVRAVGDCEGVVGFELMNEPHRGYVSIPSLHSFDYNTDLHLHDTPNALQSFALGAGHAVRIPHYVRSWPWPTRVGKHILRNERGEKAWRAEGPTQGKCVWEMHGVWGWDIKKHEPVPLREGYFKKHPETGAEIEWHEDFFYPFIKRWASRVHELTGNSKMLFIEAIPNEFCPKSWTLENQPHRMVFAPHWYDLNALFSKEFGSMSVNVQGLSRGMFILRALYWGHSGARENYTLQIRNIAENARKSLSKSRPIIIGECGIPMDMNHGAGFKTESYNWHLRMMDALMTALEQNFVGFTLWNYNPLNDDAHGDSWNGENFSWFSQSKAEPNLSTPGDLSQSNKALDAGARLLPVLVRPYPAKVAGHPEEFTYEPYDGSFKFVYRVLDSSQATSIRARETEIFLPADLASGRKLVIDSQGSDLEWSYDPKRQTLFVLHSGKGVKTLKVSLDPPLNNESVKPTPGWIKLFLTGLPLWILLDPAQPLRRPNSHTHYGSQHTKPITLPPTEFFVCSVMLSLPSQSSSVTIPTSIQEWEEAGMLLANALSNYLKLSTDLGTDHLLTNNGSNGLVARIDLSLQTLHKTLDQQLHQSRVTLAQTRNRLAAPVYCLPDEVLYNIFMYAIYSPDEHSKSWPIDMGDHVRSIYRRLYNLLSVCVIWRNLGLTHPAFWTIVPMVDSKYSCWRPRSIQLNLQRSGCQNLDLIMNSRHLPAFSRIEEQKTFLEQIPRSQSLNVHSEHQSDIHNTFAMLFHQGFPDHISQLSLCYRERSGRIPHVLSEEDYVNHAGTYFRPKLTQLTGSLSAFRITNILVDWKYITFSARLVELRVEDIVLAGNSAITAFMAALASAHELGDLKIIGVEAYADQGTTLPELEFPTILPKLQFLYLGGLYFNFLSILAWITPHSYCLTLNLSELATQNLLADSNTEEIALENLRSLLTRYSVHELILANELLAWATPSGLHHLLRAIPTLKVLVTNFCELQNEIIMSLEPPSNSPNAPFPKLEVVEFRGSLIPGSITALKTVMIKHPISRMVLGQTTLYPSGTVAPRTKEKQEVVRWLKDNVPGFQYIPRDNKPPKGADAPWQLWDF